MAPAVVKGGEAAKNRSLSLHLASFWSITLLLRLCREGPHVGSWLRGWQRGSDHSHGLPGCGDAELCHLL